MKDKAFSDRVRILVSEYANGVYSRFGKMVGVAQPTIKRYLDGDALPNFQVIRKICKTCGITPDWLVYGWEPKYQNEKSQVQKGFRIVTGGDVVESYMTAFMSVPVVLPAAWAKTLEPRIDDDTQTGYVLVNHRPTTKYIAIAMPDAGMRGEIERDDIVVITVSPLPKTYTARDLLLIKHGDEVTVRRPLGDVLYSNDPARFPPIAMKGVKVLGIVAEARRRLESERRIKKV